MKKNNILLQIAMFLLPVSALHAQTSPDGKLQVNVTCADGKPVYTVTYNGKPCMKTSPLGLNTNIGDFTKDLSLSNCSAVEPVKTDYTLYNIKRKNNHYEANQQIYTFSQNGKEVLKAIFQVSNSNIAFRYEILNSKKDAKCAVVNDEATGFFMNDGTTTFFCPQMGEMTGFARTAPSYETHYTADETMGKNGWGQGYTFPCLFKAPGNNDRPVWILVSETGVSNYPGCKIVNNGAGNYKISFPSQKENNGYGSTGAQISLPDKTPWRTLTVSDNLKDIVETTVTWNVLSTEQNNDARINKMREVHKAGYGRGAWSWIIADDASCNFDTQKEYIDFAAAMGWESLLIDAQWDRQIGRDRIAELAKYGKEKGVYLYLWYNSNGNWNDAPQTPRNCLDKANARQAEMEWLEKTGIRGIKVDFFGGDKQCTMQLYYDILFDAMKHGIKVIFHGCTLPRGWEYIFPNYVASEAVRASENLRFSQGECDREAMDATFLPFLRNAVGNMDFGGSTLNWYYNKYNQPGKGGGHRITSDVFALATAVLFQSPVQHFSMAPGNLTDAPAWALDFMKQVPTTWEDIRFIDGYPGKYVVLARKSQQGKWYLTAINGTKETLKLKLPVDMFAVGQTVNVYSDKATKEVTPVGSVKKVKIGKKQTMEAVIPVNGAFLVTE